MSDDDEDNFQSYGTLLEPYDEDTVPKKKAFSIEDQIATDDQGRRRFHGAFTGGFSAGFFNTVGSLEGWKPSEFKSSRAEKAEKKFQKAEDFMDDEDVGQFGIAPRVVRATSDYSNTVARKRTIKSDGPIPGMPVLHSILQPAKETVGIRLLKKMGWKPGQGVGPRVSKSEKIKRKREHKSNMGKIYGCEVPESFRRQINSETESSSDDDTEITFAPDDYDPFIYKPKDNFFGMGYSGLDKRPILSSHITLFTAPEFKMQDHKNKKISISGQAFGVGAFENEDEDIYTKDDMSKYDFELDSSFGKKKKTPNKKMIEQSKEKILDGFALAKNLVPPKKSFPPPVLPKNFIPKHGARISRFEPLPEHHKYFNYDRKSTMGRHDLSSSDRSKIINSSESSLQTPKKLISATFNTNADQEKSQLKEKAAKITSSLPATSIGPFKPFIANPDKQKRYEQYLALVKLGKKDELKDIQPASMADWERENEKNEFEQAAKLYKPISGLIFDRFVAASTSDDTIDPSKPVQRSIYVHGTEEMRQAAREKKFGHLTRNIEVWIPSKLLCRRCNIPEPDLSEIDQQTMKKKKGRFSVFDYYEAYQQNKPIKEGPEAEPKKEVEPQESAMSHLQDNIGQETSKELPIPNIPSQNIDNIVSVTTVLDSTPHTQELPKPELSSLLNKNYPPPIIPSTNDPALPTTSRSIFIAEKENVNDEPPPKSQIEIPKQTNLKLPEPKTISIPTDPKEKLDLFKAIFLSSSESDSEPEISSKNDKEVDKISEMKKIVLEEETAKIPPKIPDEKLVAKGIFSNMDWSKINRTKSSSVNDNVIESQNKIKDDLYGPKLPVQTPSKVSETFIRKNIPDPESNSSSSEDDEWMEIDKAGKSNKKSVKKHKKHKSEKKSEKSKHKKHKSKHKKKKHSSKH